MGFDDVITIQKRHFTSSFDPDFMFGVFGYQIETRDAQSELSSFCEFADEDASTQQLLFGYV
jgi:hypothetical protein